MTRIIQSYILDIISLLCLYNFKQTYWSRYQLGIVSDESNACCSSEGAAVKKLALEEPHQLEPSADTKQVRNAGSDQVILDLLCLYCHEFLEIVIPHRNGTQI